MSIELIIDPARLKRLRLERALSQAELGRLAGVREATVNAAENGSRTQIATIRKLAEALNIAPTDIANLVEGPIA